MLRHLHLLLLLFPLSAASQTIDSAWIENHYVKKERYVPMRDNTKLFTAVYMPEDSDQCIHPILMLRTPYSCAPYGNKWFPFWKTYFREYIKEGYIIVFQDVRGRYLSEGDFVNIRPFIPDKKTNKTVDEASDAYDTIDWLIKNIAGNNGKVGALGTSYGGFYTAMAGLSGHKALKAISPQAPVTDWFIGDDAHHNGVFMLIDMFDFYVLSGFGSPRPKPDTVQAKKSDYETNDSYSYFLRTGSLPNFTKIADQRKIAFWDELMEHPDYDRWWVSRNVRDYVNNIPAGTASLIVGGLFDAEDCFGAVNLYQSIERNKKNTNKFVFGPWRHGQWGSAKGGSSLGNIQFGSNTTEWYQENIELPFFNYYLKGEGSPDSIAEATVFFTGENKWHKFKQWPPANVHPTDMYLQSGGKLSFKKAQGINLFEEYISDPAKPVPYNEGIHKDRTVEYMDDDQRFAANRTDVLTFETDMLSNDVTLAGPFDADLVVSISTSDADFVVKLIDVFPDNFKYLKDESNIMSGYEMLVRGDIFRGRYRYSFEKPEAFIPGKLTEVKFTLNDIAHTFKKGHRIMIQVQSSWFPLADRNPQQFVDIYHAQNSNFVKSKIKLYTSESAASKIVLPIVK